MLKKRSNVKLTAAVLCAVTMIGAAWASPVLATTLYDNGGQVSTSTSTSAVTITDIDVTEQGSISFGAGNSISVKGTAITMGGVGGSVYDLGVMHGDIGTLRVDVNSLADYRNASDSRIQALETESGKARQDISRISGDVDVLRKDTDTLRTDVTMLDGKTKAQSYDAATNTTTLNSNFVAGDVGKGTFNVKDVGEGHTMVYTKNVDNNVTFMVDSRNGNIATDGSISAANGQFVVDKDSGSVGIGLKDKADDYRFKIDAATGNFKTDGEAIFGAEEDNRTTINGGTLSSVSTVEEESESGDGTTRTLHLENNFEKNEIGTGTIIRMDVKEVDANGDVTKEGIVGAFDMTALQGKISGVVADIEVSDDENVPVGTMGTISRTGIEGTATRVFGINDNGEMVGSIHQQGKDFVGTGVIGSDGFSSEYVQNTSIKTYVSKQDVGAVSTELTADGGFVVKQSTAPKFKQYNDVVINKGDVTVSTKGLANKGSEGAVNLTDLGRIDDLDMELRNHSEYQGNQTAIGGINAEAAIRRAEIADVNQRLNKVGAMAAAIASLKSIGYDPEAPSEFSIGMGQYKGQTGFAMGFFHYPNKDFMLNLSLSTSSGEVMGGIGATWRFGKNRPEKSDK